MSELSCLLGRDGGGGVRVGIHRVDMFCYVILDASKRPACTEIEEEREKHTVKHQVIAGDHRAHNTRHAKVERTQSSSVL